MMSYGLVGTFMSPKSKENILNPRPPPHLNYYNLRNSL